MPQAYSEFINENRVLTDALRKNIGQVTKMDDAAIAEMETERGEAQALNAEQERLKAELKQKTEQLDAKLKSLKQKHANAKKRVKLDIPQALWKEYGIQDTK